jgi:sialate O-acetylesterase
MRLNLGAIFNNHMVLQQNVNLKIFGEAPPNSIITIKFRGNIFYGNTDGNGEWAITLPAMKAGGPDEMTIISGRVINFKYKNSLNDFGIAESIVSSQSNTNNGWSIRLPYSKTQVPEEIVISETDRIVLTDVLVGDVWFCAGDKLMSINMIESKQGTNEILKFNENHSIRLFKTKIDVGKKPNSFTDSRWTLCDKSNLSYFSAIAYFFAKKINNDEKVPIGIIDSSNWDSAIEDWLPDDVVKADKITKPISDRWVQNDNWKGYNDGKGIDYNIVISDIILSSDNNTLTAHINLYPSIDETYGGIWKMYASKDSSIKYDIVIDDNIVAADFSGFNKMEDEVLAYTFLDNNDNKNEDLSKYDKISLRFKGKGDFFIALTQDDIMDVHSYRSGIIHACDRWSTIEMPIKSLQKNGGISGKPFTQNSLRKFLLMINQPTIVTSSGFYNAMVAPFIGYKISGVIWAHGEKNIERAYQYRILLDMLVRQWRIIFGKDIPFIVVQYPNIKAKHTEQLGYSKIAELRESQLTAYSITNTAIVSTIDMNDENFDSMNVNAMCSRISQAAEILLYGKNGKLVGPVYDSMIINGNKVIISFKNNSSGLVASNGKIKGFIISSKDRQFKLAKAEIYNNTVVVWNDEVKEPVAVRYAWDDNPDCNLYNTQGLPVLPFRTDNWSGFTDGKY